VAGDFFGSGAGGLGDLKERHGLGDDGGGIEEDEEREKLAVHERIGVREEQVEFGDDACAGRGVGLAHAGEGELPSAKEREAQRGRLFGEIEAQQRVDDLGLEVFLTHAGERDERLDGGLGLVLRERARSSWRELALDGGAGGEADEAIGAGEVRPSDGDGLGARAFGVKRVESLAEFGFRRRRERADRSRALGAGVGDAIERGLRAAAADGEIHGAVTGVDDHIGERKRFAGDEFFFVGGEGGAVGFEVERVERAVGPIGGEERALVFGGEFGAGAEDGAGG